MPNEEEKYRYIRRPSQAVLCTTALLFVPAMLSLGSYARTVPGGLLFAPYVLLLALNWVLGFWSNSRRSRFTLESHRAVVRAYRPRQYPSVDVFLPTCGEPLDVLVGVYSHVRRLAWRGPLQVYVLDDAARLEVELAAAHFGFNYVVRPDRGFMKKAGNLRHAFDVTSGDYILVLDADFSPRPEMLHETIPHFGPGIGIVQTPQFFDTNEYQSWIQYSAGATQETFYRWVQPSRDRRDAAICVGTNAVYSRSAVESAGGFCQIEHSEDVHTGFNLLREGFAVRYLPVNLAKGLCPDRLPQFVTQQYRWATGSLSLCAARKFWSADSVPWRSRLPFLTGFLYYIVTGLACLIGFIPGPYIMWVAPHLLSPANYLPFIGCYISAFFILPFATVWRTRPSIARIQLLYSFCHLVAIWDAVTRRTEGWIATGASNGNSRVVPRVLRLAVMVPLCSAVLTAAGIIHAAMSVGFTRVWPAVALLAHLVWVYSRLASDSLRELRSAQR